MTLPIPLAETRLLLPAGLDPSWLPEDTAARRALADPGDGRAASALGTRE